MFLRQRLNLELPIIQAPMAGSQGSALAVAVSAAGGLGSLPCAMLGPDAMRAELEEIRRRTDRPYNVNFFCHEPPAPDPVRERAWRDALLPYYRELEIEPNGGPSGPARLPFDFATAEALAPFKPAVVSFHFGLPSPELMAEVKRWGSIVLSTATTVAEARWLEARGVDAIIAQGVEAGGHRGMFLTSDITTQMTTMALVRQIVQAVKLPVIATGGIVDAESVAAAMALGASEVQVGTAYLLCPEATTGPVHRAALESEAADHTALTNVFTGRPARGIMNRLMRDLGPMSDLAPAFPNAAPPVMVLRARAEQAGSGDFSPLWSGQNARGCKEIPAAALTRELVVRL
jgi:nitronate monooxygenase